MLTILFYCFIIYFVGYLFASAICLYLLLKSKNRDVDNESLGYLMFDICFVSLAYPIWLALLIYVVLDDYLFRVFEPSNDVIEQTAIIDREIEELESIMKEMDTVQELDFFERPNPNHYK